MEKNKKPDNGNTDRALEYKSSTHCERSVLQFTVCLVNLSGDNYDTENPAMQRFPLLDIHFKENLQAHKGTCVRMLTILLLDADMEAS